MGHSVNDMTDDNFSKLLPKVAKPVILFFFGEFCGPSSMLDPLVGDAMEEFADQIEIIGVNVEKMPKLTKAMQVKGTPSLVFMDKGEPKGAMLGTMAYHNLQEFINRMLKSI